MSQSPPNLRPRRPFLVNGLDRVFRFLSFISVTRLAHWILRIRPSNYAFIDAYVLTHVVLSYGALFVSSDPSIAGWEWPLLLYGACRVFEMIVYLGNVIFFDERRKRKARQQYRVYGPRRSIILALMNYTEIVAWFALFYRNSWKLFRCDELCPNSFAGALYFSVVTITTLGYGDIAPIHPLGAFLICTETFIGISVLVLIVATFISARPEIDWIDDLS